MKLRQLKPEEEQKIKNWEKDRLKSITQEVVEYFPKVMLWHSVVVTFCAIRSPTDTATILTYFSIILRILIVFGWYCDKKKAIFVTCSAAETVINLALFFITLTYDPLKN